MHVDAAVTLLKNPASQAAHDVLFAMEAKRPTEHGRHSVVLVALKTPTITRLCPDWQFKVVVVVAMAHENHHARHEATITSPVKLCMFVSS